MYRTSTWAGFELLVERLWPAVRGCVHQTKLACDGITSKPKFAQARGQAARGSRRSCGGSRPARPGRRWPPSPPAIESASQLYESLTLIELLDDLRLGDEIAEPQPGQGIRLAQRAADEDLLVLARPDRRTRTRRNRRTPHRPSSGHGSRSASSSTASRLTIVPGRAVGIRQKRELQARRAAAPNAAGSDQSALNRTSSHRAP